MLPGTAFQKGFTNLHFYQQYIRMPMGGERVLKYKVNFIILFFINPLLYILHHICLAELLVSMKKT